MTTPTGRTPSEPEMQNLPGSGGDFVAKLTQRGPRPYGYYPDERPGELHDRIVRLLAEAEQIAVDLRNARNAAPLGEKTELRYACRHIEQAAAIIRKAGI